MAPRPVVLLLVSGLLSWLLVACGDDAVAPDAGQGSPTSSPPASPSRPVEFRLVLATDDEPAPDSEILQQLSALDCAAEPAPVPADQPVAVCDAAGTKYVLEPAAVVGGVASAVASLPEGQSSWAVAVQLDPDAAQAFADLTAGAAATEVRVAVVVDGVVVSAPTVRGEIPGGLLQLSGDLTERSAADLAARLRAT